MSDVPRPFKQSLPSYIEAEDRLLDLVYEKFLGSTLTEEEAQQVKSVDNDLLYYDLKILLNEVLDIPAPVLQIDQNYEFVPFELVTQEYLSLYEKYSNELHPKSQEDLHEKN